MRTNSRFRLILGGSVAVVTVALVGAPNAANVKTGLAARTGVCLDSFVAAAAPNAVECMKQTERPDELASARAQHDAIRSAPDGYLPSNANSTAIATRERIARAAQAAVNAHAWTQRGKGPLQSQDAGYTGTNGLGLVELAGRITNFAYDEARGRVYASLGDGGIFLSKNKGATWTSIGDHLPMQAVGAVGYAPVMGGTVIALTGDGSYGASSMEGSGAYRSMNGGKSWQHARGVPSDAFSFKVAVDPTNPRIIYAATGAGLYRSTDAGASYANVSLPVGACAGKSNHVKGCLFANMVTDVVVQTPGGATGAKGGKIVAVVGWRAGQQKNPDGSVQSPNNGIYTSDTGKPGSFKKEAATGFARQSRIGRVELGAAIGPTQDHNYLYALVQDAFALHDGLPAIDADDPTGTYKRVSVLEGVYVSRDFGVTWVKMADNAAFQAPTTGSSLAVVAQGTGNYGPGVQAWYNEWIQPDPSRDLGGVPTRLLLGLEEVWQNEDTLAPQFGPTSFKVIGRYFSGSSCQFLDLTSTVPAYLCPTQRDEALDETTTTHPDQHAALFIANGQSVTLLVGNDGGAYRQTVPTGGEFTNAQWGVGSNRGMDSTLLLYSAARAKDSTIAFGLQDNGTGKITNVKLKGVMQYDRQITTLGGDGFFVGIDPDNSLLQYGEYTYGALSATKDGGKNWAAMGPPITHGQFSTPFVLDPLDAQHLMIGGREIVETGSGAGTSAADWAKVFDLGTPEQPGNAKAKESDAKDFNSMTAIDLNGSNAYVGFCGVCDVLNTSRAFKSGIATNVGGTSPSQRYRSNGWHIAKAIGLPERYITAMAFDPARPKTVYVTLGGYSRRWTPPGSLDNGAANANGGHVYKSLDAGEHFFDISGNLPNTPTNAIALRMGNLVVGTDIGIFASDPRANCGSPTSSSCDAYQVLGQGMPNAEISTIQVAPWDQNLITVATFGRGAWEYRFGPPTKPTSTKPKPLPNPIFLGKTVGSFDFETSDQGWVTTGGDQVGSWRRSAPGHASSNGWQVLPYTDASTYALISPEVKLPARSTIKVSWWYVENTEPCCDGFGMDWSSDGHVWHQVKTQAGQNPDFPNYTQDSASFVAPAGSLYLRYRLTSDQLVSAPAYTGVMLDDVLIRR